MMRNQFDFLETERLFGEAVTRPDGKRRQEDLFRTYEQVAWRARKLGIKDIFLMGSLASPILRDYRPHDDCDIFVPKKEECFALMDALAYKKERPFALYGTSLHYATHPGTGVAVELRYAVPVKELPTGTVWQYVQPIWSHVVMPNPMIMPPSALSGKDETTSWWGIPSRFVHGEYNWLIKSQSPYPKDQLDAARLCKQGLDFERAQRIQDEISSVGGTLMLPPQLISIVRSFGFWNMSKSDYQILHGLRKKKTTL